MACSHTTGIPPSDCLIKVVKSSITLFLIFHFGLGCFITSAVSWCFMFQKGEGRLPSVQTSYHKKWVALGYDIIYIYIIINYNTLLPRELIPIHRASRDTLWRPRLARHQPIWRKQSWLAHSLICGHKNRHTTSPWLIPELVCLDQLLYKVSRAAHCCIEEGGHAILRSK